MYELSYQSIFMQQQYMQRKSMYVYVIHINVYKNDKDRRYVFLIFINIVFLFHEYNIYIINWKKFVYHSSLNNKQDPILPHEQDATHDKFLSVVQLVRIIQAVLWIFLGIYTYHTNLNNEEHEIEKLKILFYKLSYLLLQVDMFILFLRKNSVNFFDEFVLARLIRYELDATQDQFLNGVHLV